MSWGNGAYVVHRSIEKQLDDYSVLSYNPYLTLFPPLFKKYQAECKSAGLIHSTPDYAYFFRQRNIPLVISFQNYVLDKWMAPYSTCLQRIHYASDLKWWTILSIKSASRITAVSEFTAATAKSDLGMARPVEIIYNGVDQQLFRPGKRKAAKNGAFRVFFAGNLTLRKGAQWLGGIAEKLSRGITMNYTQGLRKRGKLLPGKQMIPIGPVPFEQMPNRYREMDILLMPTVREGFSLAVLEAMASGLPVVASNCSSLPEQIDDGKGGFLCPIGDVDAFAEKINILAESPKLRKEMGEYNRVKVENLFTLDGMVAKYKELFEDVIENCHGAE
jgi:L-malate glycosyltransferase